MSTEKNENDVVIEAWNTVLFEKFCSFEHVLTDGLAIHGRVALDRHPHAPGARVVDIGCGFGDTCRAIAEQVGPTGHVVGIDCAENFVNRASADARRAGHDNTSFRVADVQSGDLGGPYDAAFSRFGTMFFNFPGAALRNIRESLEPGGRLSMVVWRKREDNPWLFAAEQRVKEIVPVVDHAETDAVHCGPGPFSMAGADTVSDMLQSSGYDRIAFERFDADICIGRSLEEAIDFAMTLGPAGEVIRLAGEEGEALRPDVESALGKTLQQFVRDDGVWAHSSTWIVTAYNP